jgi:Mrp family chromosome partitioning ATPase
MLLVVRLKKNKRGAVKRTLSALDSHGAAVMGIIANDVDPSLEDYRSADYDAYYVAGGRRTKDLPATAETAEPVGAT